MTNPSNQLAAVRSTAGSPDNFETIETSDGQTLQRVKFDFDVSRRGFMQVLGAGIVIASSGVTLLGQQRGGRGGFGGGGNGPSNLDARLHIATDGTITLMSGKVEGGQGARAEITQAAAEELRVPIDRVRLILCDTSLCPDDGPTFGSQTTPRTLPIIRGNCAAARDLLLNFAASQWNLTLDSIIVRDGAAIDKAQTRKLTYSDLASQDAAAFKGSIPPGSIVTPTSEWKIMGVPTPRPDARDLVTGAHQYPSAVVRQGMLYAKVLRAPAYGATLKSVDVSAAKAMDGVVVVQDGDFVAVAAPTTYQAANAIETIAKTAQWDRSPFPSSKDLPQYLRNNVNGGMPQSPFTDALKSAAKVLRASYDVAYVQHTPMETRAAVAEWEGDQLTVWTAGQVPFGIRSELVNNLRVPADRVRVIIPDFGGAFGGKHTGECAVEAARIAKSAGKPVALRWTREEEFTWAAFRSAAAIDLTASLDDKGVITSWHHAVVQTSNAAPDTPYHIANARSENPASRQPLRTASYRALGATANVFARESFMDELAAAAGKNPLQFRLDHLDNPRLLAVLEDAARRFDWATHYAKKEPNIGVGLACGIDKGSFVAACAQVAVDRQKGTIRVLRIAETFECGAIVNPLNLRNQVQGAMIQGLGPALREAMEFEDGVMQNAALSEYKVPRFVDVPQLDINLLNRPDLPSAGAGETPLIPVAPAIANAIFNATGQRVRQMPIRLAAET